jgi:tRNA A-37 threonylcarbamoyl transferase component Bud32
MHEPPDPNPDADIPTAAVDSLDAGLAAAFGRRAEGPRSCLGAVCPVLLKEVQGENDHVVRPRSDAMPAPEQTGARYQLQGEIARGGMGAVLRARDVDLGREMAIKVLLEKYVNRPEVARRFIEEAQIGGQLQHPGVVPVYDIGRFGERPFFTMKLIKGQTLAALLGARNQPTEDRPRLLRIALQVCEALAYAHAKGVIHRDLKPANVMVGAFGEVQVMDWGLAKVLAEGGIADEERASRQHQPDDGTQIRTARSDGMRMLGSQAYKFAYQGDHVGAEKKVLQLRGWFDKRESVAAELKHVRGQISDPNRADGTELAQFMRLAEGLASAGLLDAAREELLLLKNRMLEPQTALAQLKAELQGDLAYQVGQQPEDIRGELAHCLNGALAAVQAGNVEDTRARVANLKARLNDDAIAEARKQKSVEAAMKAYLAQLRGRADAKLNPDGMFNLAHDPRVGLYPADKLQQRGGSAGDRHVYGGRILHYQPRHRQYQGPSRKTARRQGLNGPEPANNWWDRAAAVRGDAAQSQR